MQIPNGLKFYLPELKWQAPQGASFNVIAQSLHRAIEGNAKLADARKWPRTVAGCEDWVDTFNATICARMGWSDYIVSESGVSPPKLSAPHQDLSASAIRAAAAKAKHLVRGARTLKEWVESNEPPVSSDLALKRAQVCAACPRNEEGDWTKWFTVPAAELIRRLVAHAQGRRLVTPRDPDLHLCGVCYCPMKLKVHIPIDWIRKHQTPEEAAALQAVPNCWIPREP